MQAYNNVPTVPTRQEKRFTANHREAVSRNPLPPILISPIEPLNSTFRANPFP